MQHQCRYELQERFVFLIFKEYNFLIQVSIDSWIYLQNQYNNHILLNLEETVLIFSHICILINAVLFLSSTLKYSILLFQDKTTAYNPQIMEQHQQDNNHNQLDKVHHNNRINLLSKTRLNIECTSHLGDHMVKHIVNTGRDGRGSKEKFYWILSQRDHLNSYKNWKIEKILATAIYITSSDMATLNNVWEIHEYSLTNLQHYSCIVAHLKHQTGV